MTEIAYMTKIRSLTAVAAFGLLGSFAFTPPASAIGCISGGAAGAVAGHMAHHGVLGAIGGCVAGHEAHKYSKRREMQGQTQQPSYTQSQYPQATPQDTGPSGTAR